VKPIAPLLVLILLLAFGCRPPVDDPPSGDTTDLVEADTPPADLPPSDTPPGDTAAPDAPLDTQAPKDLADLGPDDTSTDICQPQCQDRLCGPNACGGSCGDCAQGQVCTPATGTCGPQCPPADQQCSPGQTRCNGPALETCEDSFAGPDQPGECWLFSAPQTCPQGQTCQPLDAGSASCACPHAACGPSCCANAAQVCYAGECCTPKCLGIVCGSDGCGGTCGTCDQGFGCIQGKCLEMETCTSDCVPGTQTCDGPDAFRQCLERLPVFPGCWVFSAVAKPCGPQQQCDPDDGHCKCVPDCQDRQCGDDGCGGTCGQCLLPSTCDQQSQCTCRCPQWEGVTGWEVCGSDRQTYPNPCEAECAGAASFALGPCAPCDCTLAEQAAQQLCGTDHQTYASFCDLRCAIGSPTCLGGQANCPEIASSGPCPTPPECQPQGQPACPDTYAPVCGSDGQTWWNLCHLEGCGGGATMACDGVCQATLSCPACDQTCEPVCGLVGVQLVTFPNLCTLDCLAAELFYSGGPCHR
jgi:hypothetical protein